ncbi:methyltransferase [Archaeoglobales archaeon]|nr:MAG: methyltransferase [Archaeoglobales archaeon]
MIDLDKIKFERDIKIAIGIYRERENYADKIYNAAKKLKDLDIVVVDEGENTEKKLVEIGENRRVDAILRGTARASKTIKILKEKYTTIARLAVLEARNKLFILVPVGVDEGEIISEKIFIVEEAVKLAKKLGMNGRVGVLSGGRKADIGRSRKVDNSIVEAEFLTNYLKDYGFDAEHYEILIEDAIKKVDIIVAPDGITGNLIFRTLCYLGDGKEYGAPIAGLPFVFVDTSRAQTIEGYIRAIKLAYILACESIQKSPWWA